MCRIYGYARVSTKKQSLERQIENIRHYNSAAVIITEEYTGTTIDRPKFKKLIKSLSEGDTVIFDEVSRMSRTAEEGFKLYEDLYNRGINLVFLKEPQINTDTYKEAGTGLIQLTGTDLDLILSGINAYIMKLAQKQIAIAFGSAQSEVDHLHKRTSEGVQRAIADGKQVGRKAGTKIETQKSKAVKEQILKLSKDFNGTNTDIEVMRITGISRNTFYKYKGELKAI